MIRAISSLQHNSNLSNNLNLKRTSQVAFTGSPINLLKNEGKTSRFAVKTASSMGNIFKRLLGKAELPFSKKPLTANATLTHIGPDGMPIEIPMPEVHTAVAKVLDGSNILTPDAADIAANTADAVSTKAALADVLGGSSHAFDAVTGGLDAAATKSDIVDTIGAGSDLISAKADAADIFHTIIDGITGFFDNLPL